MSFTKYKEAAGAQWLLLQSYLEGGYSEILDVADKENPLVFDNKPYYFSIGADALKIMVKALIQQEAPAPKTILDFPCGSGRVARHLAAYFKGAHIVGCDLYEPHVKFCRDIIRIDARLSKENLADVQFEEKFDLIFCGSLLTHLPEDLCIAALDMFRRSLSDTGIAVVTFHGRYSEHLQTGDWKYLSDELYAVAQQQVEATGFGYVDYGHDLKLLFNKQTNYGITLIRPSWLMRYLEACPDIRILSYIERGWDAHQDVCIFGRPGVSG